MKKVNSRIVLEVGDRVIFGGNKTNFAVAELVKQAQSAGLRVQGKFSNMTDLLVHKSNGSPSKTVAEAERLLLPVLDPDEFSNLLRSLINKTIAPKIEKASSFRRISLEGATIYPSNLEIDQKESLKQYLLVRGAKLGQQIRPSLTAAICDGTSKNLGELLILESENIPIFDLNQINVQLL